MFCLMRHVDWRVSSNHPFHILQVCQHRCRAILSGHWFTPKMDSYDYPLLCNSHPAVLTSVEVMRRMMCGGLFVSQTQPLPDSDLVFRIFSLWPFLLHHQMQSYAVGLRSLVRMLWFGGCGVMSSSRMNPMNALQYSQAYDNGSYSWAVFHPYQDCRGISHIRAFVKWPNKAPRMLSTVVAPYCHFLSFLYLGTRMFHTVCGVSELWIFSLIFVTGAEMSIVKEMGQNGAI